MVDDVYSSDWMNRANLSALCRTYADLLRRQRTTEGALAKWTRTERRANDFVWLGDDYENESVLLGCGSMEFGPGDALFERVHKLYGTAQLNPYERELLYGFPYVVGLVGKTKVRGPLLTIAVEIVVEGNLLVLQPTDDFLRFNSLPFRSDYENAAHDQALARILGCTPALPLTIEALSDFVATVTRELPDLHLDAQLDGSLDYAPKEPRVGDALRLIDQAAVFVAPKVNYFLRSDLEEIAEDTGACGALDALVSGGGDAAQVDITDKQVDAARLVYPFPSNRAQRRVALLVDDPTTRVVRVEGPPGTGKSLTIANLVCHLAASGRRVLVTSQKDKALEVVDSKLRELNLTELPMTLLRQDRKSKDDLINRLGQVGKQRSTAEVTADYQRQRESFNRDSSEQRQDADAFAMAIFQEAAVEKAVRSFQSASSGPRLSTRWSVGKTLWSAHRQAPLPTDALAERIGRRRAALTRCAFALLGLGLEQSVSTATRGDHLARKELLAALRRDQRSYKNFSLFDRLKSDPERAEKLLRMLPVWIMSPDDAARLFPCRPNLFDVVIVDEASQVDLPSIAPIAYRANTLVIFGDTRQMQSQRFAFMNGEIATEAWERFGMRGLDPDEVLHPVKQSLLGLAAIRAEEECLLNEHFRSLPPLIDFSNHRWYRDQLRIMTDVRHKRFGKPGQPVAELHHVAGGVVTPDTQENATEAAALVTHLSAMVQQPEYANASIGVLCLFNEQAALVRELVNDTIDEAEIAKHDIVVVNPDGFQGDERDVILYSLSWDNQVMPRAALSARQMDTAHIQGMLNVAFTRARDEVHVFHSAPINTFALASGAGAISDWLAHCRTTESQGGVKAVSRVGRVDSEFEAEVADSLRAQSVTVTHQYPACGFFIDLLCEFQGKIVGVECDGEAYHLDEHGRLKIEDVERQDILERAGFTIVRIPYRKWRKDPWSQVQRVFSSLRDEMATYVPPTPTQSNSKSSNDIPANGLHPPLRSVVSPREAPPRRFDLNVVQAVVMEAVRDGHRDEDELLRFCREKLGYGRLGPKIRRIILECAAQLRQQGLIVVEDREYFPTPTGRSATVNVVAPRPKTPANRNAAQKRPRTRRR